MISHIYIIYNPNSTGPGEAKARDLVNRLEQSAPHIQTELIATTHARHAIEISKKHAHGPTTMIVSSSGDGGFHEVVNGVLTSEHPDTIVGLLPSGNANDHYHSRHHGDIVERIISADIKTVPVLDIRWGDHKMYAHSYAGVGLTAQIGQELNKNQLNLWSEIMIVLSGLVKNRGVRLIIDGRPKKYDSLIYAISGQMSKYIQTGADQISDERMSVIATPRRPVGRLIASLIRRTKQPEAPSSAASAEFTTTRQITMQCDGEIIDLPRTCTVNITVQSALHEII